MTRPYRYFADLQIRHMLTARPKHSLGHLQSLLESLAAGESSLELPNKLVFDDADAFSDFRVMPFVIGRPGAHPADGKTGRHQQPSTTGS